MPNNRKKQGQQAQKQGGQRPKPKPKATITTRAPVAVAQQTGFSVPARARSHRVKNSEMIQTLQCLSGGFTVSFTDNINPGIHRVFPWLSAQAQQWQQYRFHSLRFRYVTRSATASPGSVILTPEYNPAETPPADEQSAANSQDAKEGSIWQNINCPMNVSAMFPAGGRKIIRTQPVSGDANLYDTGIISVSFSGASISAGVGVLWVDYDVEFFVPQTSPPSFIAKQFSCFQNIQGAVTTGAQRAIGFTPLQSDTYQSPMNPLRITAFTTGTGVNDTTRFEMPTGRYAFWITLPVGTFTGLSAGYWGWTLQLYVDGLQANPQMFTSYNSGNAPVTTDSFISMFGWFQILVGQDLEFRINLTGAGTLTIAPYGRLMFSLL